MKLRLTTLLLSTIAFVRPSLFGAALENNDELLRDVPEYAQQALTSADVGCVETFTFKDWEEAFEMGKIVCVLSPYFNPEDLTSHVSVFMQSLREKIQNEFDRIVPLELRNPGLINLCENHPLRLCVSIVDSRVDLESATPSDKDYLAGIATFLMAQDTIKISALAWKNLKTLLLEKMESLRNSIRRQDIVADFRRSVIPARTAYNAQKGTVRDDLVGTMKRMKKKAFSESIAAINKVLQSLNRLGRVGLPLEERRVTAAKKVKEIHLVDGKEVEVETETPVTVVVALQSPKESSLQEYLNVIREAVNLLNQLKHIHRLNSEDSRSIENAEKMLECSPHDIINELNSHTRRISNIPFDEALGREIALLNASNKAETFYRVFLPKVEDQIKRLVELVNKLDQLGEDSFQADYHHPSSQRHRIVKELIYVTDDNDPRLNDPVVKVLTKTWQESLDKIPEGERKGVVHVIKSTYGVIGGSFMEMTKRMIIPAGVPEDARFVRKTFMESGVRKTRWVAIYWE